MKWFIPLLLFVIGAGTNIFGAAMSTDAEAAMKHRLWNQTNTNSMVSISHSTLGTPEEQKSLGFICIGLGNLLCGVAVITGVAMGSKRK